MLRFFRKIRQGLLLNNNFSKYFVYAIGEILLVVLGILIAVRINGWNENRKNKTLLHSYQENLITELKADLIKLNALDSVNDLKKRAIKNYFKYYDSKSPEPELLLQKMDSINSSKRAFYTNAYTIEDLITTGNLSLFPETKRRAILKLKNIHEQYSFYETSTIQDVALYEQEIKKKFDLVYLTGLTTRQSETTKAWRADYQSENFKTLNNSLVENLKLFNFQTEMYQVISKETSELLNLISLRK